jgi:hypothetical protein
MHGGQVLLDLRALFEPAQLVEALRGGVAETV